MFGSRLTDYTSYVCVYVSSFCIFFLTIRIVRVVCSTFSLSYALVPIPLLLSYYILVPICSSSLLGNRSLNGRRNRNLNYKYVSISLLRIVRMCSIQLVGRIKRARSQHPENDVYTLLYCMPSYNSDSACVLNIQLVIGTRAHRSLLLSYYTLVSICSSSLLGNRSLSERRNRNKYVSISVLRIVRVCSIQLVGRIKRARSGTPGK